jgi:hypothetical protein
MLPVVMPLMGGLSVVVGVLLLLAPQRVVKVMRELLEIFWGDRFEPTMIRTPRLGGALMILFGIAVLVVGIGMSLSPVAP